jgi:hypothetical protein
MPTVKLAHIREQGNDIIIVPLDSAYGRQTEGQQEAELLELQARASASGLKGHVVIVWDAGGGRMGFRAPPKWHPFFRSIGLQFVLANLNRELTWT